MVEFLCEKRLRMRMGLVWVNLHANLVTDVALDFWWVFAYYEGSGDRILQKILEFTSKS